ncbi:IpaD/SipD/SspD family type III secretion system needle tip protein [Proteus vulgaris]|uniref:IpaD/SipD/SspD family type III secretion system needle tip protein n=2 Tax=Proteus TaxID=583 RepID=UPI0021B0F011|nr:IpaD/SipD/SspD family type III secretion system needle tip protein [Proteus vulgaris]MCT6516829.1 IpaD/SipD/SspD family type III secretion system needle tip protein [Proteus vulgaris]
MPTIIDSNIYQSNKKIDLTPKSSNKIEYNKDDFLDNAHFLLEDVKREYQYISTNEPQVNKILENLSPKEKGFYLDEQYVKNYINQQKNLNKINQISDIVNIDQPIDKYPTDSLSDLFNEVKKSIILGKNDYLDVFKNVFSKYMDFVKDLREKLAELSTAVKASSKDGYINIDVKKLLNNLNMISANYSDNNILKMDMSFKKESDGRYSRVVNGEKIYYKNVVEAENASLEVLKLLNQIKGVTSERQNLSSSVQPNLSFWFDVNIDLSGVDKLINYLKAMPQDPHDILQTEFDLLKKTLDAVEKQVNTNLDELSKKYSTANSNYDNFVKIVSSTMDTLLEMAKGFLRF